MAIAVQCFVVIAKFDAVEHRWPGGEAGYAAAAPNATYCSDGHLCTVGFMGLYDANAWIEHLISKGLESPDSQTSEIALFNDRTGPHQPTPWLRHDDAHQRVWLEGQPSTPVVSFAGLVPGGAHWVPAEDLTDYERMEEADGVTRFVHRDTGEVRYLGQPPPPNLDPLEQSYAVLYTAVWDLAEDLRTPLGEPQRQRLEALLVEATTLRETLEDDAWCTLLIGVAERRLGRWPEAEQAFRRLTEQQPDLIGGWLDLVWALGEQGKHDEAVTVAEHAVNLDPESSSAWGNLAAVLLGLERLPECRDAIERAIALEPNSRTHNSVSNRLRKLERAAKPWWRRLIS